MADLDVNSEKITSVNVVNILAMLSFFAAQRQQLYCPFIDHFGDKLMRSLKRFGVNSNIVELICDSLKSCKLEVSSAQLRRVLSENACSEVVSMRV